MSDLHLDSLKIEGFRAFKHLEVERLGRVNLIVGKNNVGKTSLLEAIQMYAHDSFLGDLAGTLSFHQARSHRREGKGDVTEIWFQVLQNLFHGYPSLQERPRKCIEISDGQRGNSRVVRFDYGEEGYSVTSKKGDREIRFSITSNSSADGIRSPENKSCFFIPSEGLPFEKSEALWDDITLTDKENHVLSALRIIEPEVERVNLIKSPDTNYSFAGTDTQFSLAKKRVPVVKVSGRKKPTFLHAMGEGMNRLLGIALALVNAEHGFLLIDEIENGLHYSVQPDVWRLIFEMADRLDVQVFATTHSKDCIQAFQRAADEHKDEGLLISLRRKRDDPEEIVAVLADEEDLDVAVHSQIEMR